MFVKNQIVHGFAENTEELGTFILLDKSGMEVHEYLRQDLVFIYFQSVINFPLPWLRFMCGSDKKLPMEDE